jgi:DNA polymerase (family 10)
MNRTVAAIVNNILSTKVKKSSEYTFVVNNREYVLYPDGVVWRRKQGVDWKKKFTFNGSLWVTEKGRPALVLKDMTKKLVRRLGKMSKTPKKTFKTKIPKGAKKTLEKVPKNKIDRISSRKKKQPLSEARRLVRQLKKILKKLGLTGIEVGGSIRRKEAVVGDIDLMAIGNINIVKNYKGFEFIKGREKSVTFIFKDQQVNLYAYKKKYYGSMLLFLTGPGPYNIALRRIAKQQNMKLSQYGLFDVSTNKLLAAKTEERIYKKLGKEYKDPELRGKGTKKVLKKPKLELEEPAKISTKKLNDEKYSHEDIYKYIKTLSDKQIEKIIKRAKQTYYNK